MKTLAPVALLAASLAVGCRTTPVEHGAAATVAEAAAPVAVAAEAPRRSPTQIVLSGTPGATVWGYYIQDGERVVIGEIIPWTLEGTGISDVRIEKADRPDTVIADVRYYKDGALSNSRYTLGPQVRSLRILINAGDSATAATTMPSSSSTATTSAR